MPKFTQYDLDDWEVYEEVRIGGQYNMFDPRARQSTGLTNERYSFVMKWYSELKVAVEAQSKNKP